MSESYNRLIHEKSLYLKQHAANPVHWYPWSDEALAKAKHEDKLILVSIGYSTCHWCHVMERESFENEQVAEFMNDHFICIKVDKEERPDIDAFYMDALLALNNGSGGWPLNCFLLPDQRPFFAGTYFPPTAQYGRPSWMDVLVSLRKHFTSNRSSIEKQADELITYLTDHSLPIKSNQIDIDQFEEEVNVYVLHGIFQQLTKSFDNTNGGFNAQPKFPTVAPLRFLVNYHLAFDDKTSLDHVKLTLNKIICGGIHDHLGGGFARYTVDEEWMIPHFEKMLYDNAMLLSILADVYKITLDRSYKDTFYSTLTWLKREMYDDGLFNAAIDADSEGEEGKFYVWDESEVDSVLGKLSPMFKKEFNIRPNGNWEGKNILHRNHAMHSNKLYEIDKEITERLNKAKELLFSEREKRKRPLTDHKKVLDWNCMVLISLVKGYKSFGDPSLLPLIKEMIVAIEKSFISSDELYHVYYEGEAKVPALLDDYAWLIAAYLEADSVLFNNYGLKAVNLCDKAIQLFWDPNDSMFFINQENELLLRNKTIYDATVPCGASVMFKNMLRMSIMYERNDFRELAIQAILSIKDTILKYPLSFSNWADCIYSLTFSVNSIHIMGQDNHESLIKLYAMPLFNTLIKSSVGERNQFIVCKDFTCNLPVNTIEEAINLL